MNAPELQGRVSSASNMALNGPQTIGTAVGAALIAVVDYRILIVSDGRRHRGVRCAHRRAPNGSRTHGARERTCLTFEST
jgi:hypothetical protein